MPKPIATETLRQGDPSRRSARRDGTKGDLWVPNFVEGASSDIWVDRIRSMIDAGGIVAVRHKTPARFESLSASQGYLVSGPPAVETLN